MSHRFSFAALFCLGLFAFGCTVTGRTGADTGPGGGTDTNSRVDAFAGPGAIVVLPANYEATIMGAPVEVDYQAFRVEAGGAMTDVTAMATFTIGGLGTFTGSHFTSGTDRGGIATVIATVGASSGNTMITLHLNRDIVDPSAPSDAPTMFGGTPDASAAPAFVYPDDGVMIPPNLERFELHFRPVSGTTLFRMDLSTGPVELRIFFGCQEPVGGGCIYTPDHDTWGAIAAAARGLGPVTYTLTATDGAGRVGTSEPRHIQFANEDIMGGVYYWNAAAGSIMRYEFGVPGAVEETYLRGNTINCIGCHAVSRDGRRIAVGRGIPTSNVQVYDVATRMQVYQNFRDSAGTALGWRPNFFSFNPTATQIVGSNPRGLRIADATGQLLIQDIAATNASMPDWSPDGDQIVYVSVPGTAIEAPAVSGGSIAVVDYDGSSWVPGATLAAADGGNNYHPTYSPDSAWVLYNRSPSNINSMGNSTGDGDCVTDAEMWMVAASGTGAATRLDIGGACSSWPKFDPTPYRDHGHPLFWVAWATARGYGLRYADGSIMQIWMAAFDPTLAEMGMSPTHPAFRLPFQNIATGNHIAQWVTHIERMGCTTDAECGGEFCIDNRCFQEPPVF